MIITLLPKYWIGSIKLVIIYLILGVLNAVSASNFSQRSFASSPLILSNDEKYLWVVCPDADQITKINVKTQKVIEEIKTGEEPWSITTANDKLFIANRKGGFLTILDQNGKKNVWIGHELGGVVSSPDGRYIYLTLSSTSQLAIFDTMKQVVTKYINVNKDPWGIAVWSVSKNKHQIVVTHRISQHKPNAKRAAMISIIEPETGTIKQLQIPNYEFGASNGLENIVIANDYAFIPHILQNPTESRKFHNTISGAVSSIALKETKHPNEIHIDTNDSSFSTPVNFPRGIAINTKDDKVYIVLAGSDLVMGIDIKSTKTPRLIGFWQVGKNPRGIIINNSGTKAYVMNYLSRDVSILDLTDEIHRTELGRITVTKETLIPTVLKGKILFNKANDPRLSRLGWVSCASCHFDGGVDGTTWPSPEGLRQTKPLWDLEGTAPFHVNATRDEIQDFELDIERFMGGVGLAPGLANSLLGESNAYNSKALDALAKFVLTGIRVPQSHKTLTSDQLSEGRKNFKKHCAHCHGGKKWTTSHLPKYVRISKPVNADDATRQITNNLKTVGTYNPKYDKVGKDGFDIPTLLGIKYTPPYFHDGSAMNLEAVLKHPIHGGKLDQAEKISIINFIKTIDSRTPPLPSKVKIQ